MIYGTVGAVIQAKGSFGGGLVVFEGKPELKIGGFNFNMDDLPAVGDVLPCGTPVYCDEETRDIIPVITAKVIAIDGTAVTLEDHGFGNVAFKAGVTVAKLGDDLEAVATNYATIASKNGNVLTLSAAVTGLAVGDILVEATGTSASASAKVLVKKPNTFIEKDEELLPTEGYGFQNANYSISTVYNKQAWIKRMQPLPKYVLALNKSLIDGIFWI